MARRAKEPAHCRLERCSSSRVAVRSASERSSWLVRSRSSSTSTTRSARVASASYCSVLIVRGAVSKTHRVPIGTPAAVTSLLAA